MQRFSVLRPSVALVVLSFAAVACSESDDGAGGSAGNAGAAPVAGGTAAAAPLAGTGGVAGVAPQAGAAGIPAAGMAAAGAAAMPAAGAPALDAAVPADAAADTDGAPPGDAAALDAAVPADAGVDAAVTPIEGLPTAPIGYASMSGLGVPTTTGGEGGNVVQATTGQQLIDYAASNGPLVIEVHGTLDAPRVQLASNKTLRGVDGATIRGGLRIRGSSSAFVSNVIIQNLTVDGRNSDVDGDAVQVHYAHHVWIDHCAIFDGADGNLDIVHGSDFVTVSFTKFWYSNPAPDEGHRFSNLIGHSDSNAAEDDNALDITWHHNWWAERVHERMPRVRFGNVHLFNNYYSSTGNNYAVRAGVGASILIESNYFDGVDTPHEIDGSGASVVARDNVYDATTGAQDTAGSAFTPPYAYTPDAAAGVPAFVRANAGPR